MSRIIYPTDFIGQKKLLTNINAKHIADGANSLLTPYLVQQNIDLDDCITKATVAEGFNDNQSATYKQSENNNQLKKLHSDTAIQHLKMEVQFLKKMFYSNVKELGNWGIELVGKGKIKYPKSFDDLANIAVIFFDKHLSFPIDTSPLQPFILKNNIDVVADKTAIENATQLKLTANQEANIAANFTQQRNLLWQPIVKNLKGIGNYLKNLYIDNPYSLGNYGFLVVATARKPKMVTTKILLQQSKTINSVIIGSTLMNIGNVSVKIYKGRQVKGDYIEIKAQEDLKIAKGFSIITILNDDLIKTAVIIAHRTV